MSDELRVRLFLEQVEEVEKLMNAKQQAVKDVTAALEGSEGEIASLRRLKARHAAEAAVVVAQVAQQDAEIKLAEEQIGLLEDKVEQHEKEMLEHRRQEEIKARDQLDRATKEINEQKLKLSKEEEQVAKAKELLAAMKFDEQLSKLQEKIKSLEGQEAVAKAEYDQAAAQLKQIIGDVEPSGLEVQERPWPDATVLHRPVRTVGDALGLLKRLKSDRKVQATLQLVQHCSHCLSRPMISPEEDTESVTEPTAKQGTELEVDKVKEDMDMAPPGAEAEAESGTAEAMSVPVHPKPFTSGDGDVKVGELDEDALRSLFGTAESLEYGKEQLKQVTDQVAAMRAKKEVLEKDLEAAEAERQETVDAVAGLECEIQKQQRALSEYVDL